MTFTQKSTTYKQDGTSTAETWYEAALLPGRLRIDIGPASDGKGYIFSGGNLSVIKDNKVVASVKSINMMVFDESIDKYNPQNVSLDVIDPTMLPNYIDAHGNCVRLWPHSALRSNTIFEVVKASGRRTA